MYVRLDNDDPELETIKNLSWPEEFEIHVGPRIGLSRSLNEVFEQYPDQPWYGLLADDLEPSTLHWDQLLVDRAGSWDISYPNDGAPVDSPTHPCIGGKLVRTIGWLGFPPCYHFFTDTIWQYIGGHLNNIYRLDNITVEHLHYSLNKAAKDQIYMESTEKWKQDKRSYRDWIETNGELLIQQLQRDIYNS